MPTEALRSLVLLVADDELIIGHRDSEWTGHAPIIEEDIAFSSIAQDELGHSLAWYTIYEQLGGGTPDEVAFSRSPQSFTCCHFVEHPKGDWAYTIVRQYLYDTAEKVRLEAFQQSSSAPLRELASKILPEEHYHLLHSRSWVERLGDATPESHRRMQFALDEAFPAAVGMFESFEGEQELTANGVFPGHQDLLGQWLDEVVPVCSRSGLKPPVRQKPDAHGEASGEVARRGTVKRSWAADCVPEYGGRRGKHTEHLKELLDAMQMVYRLEPNARW
ncbi:MAG: 1,2-phenylacetyl-CoA epoxidase subunit PaaC [Bacteroidota bacterium]